jgi:DNA-binding beta-propeller fold protein YncE
VRRFLPLILVAGCAHKAASPAEPAAPQPQVTGIALPGAGPGVSVSMDYIAYDHTHHRVWVPMALAGAGSVAIVDATNGHVEHVDGFATKEVERKGKKRTMGPSSAAIGDNIVYVGNRGDSTVCPIAADTLEKSPCKTLESSPDALLYVPSLKELWVTAPREQSIIVLDATAPDNLSVKTKIKLDGAPEGFAIDDARGLFFTNLEDKDRTLSIDMKSRQVKKTWVPGCGEDGPKGLAVDHGREFVIVACTDHVMVLDAGHDGQELSSLETGAGVDNVEYVEASHKLYVGAGRAARLTVASVDEKGKLARVTAITTAPGARNAVVSDEGAIYLTCAPQAKVLAVTGLP